MGENHYNEDIGFLVKQIHIKFEKDFNFRLKECDLTVAQISVLTYLMENCQREITQKDIEGYFDLKHPTVIGILQRLEKKDFIKSCTCEQDKRFRIIKATEKAFCVKEKMDANKRQMDNRLVQNMTATESEMLLCLLKKALNNLCDLPQ